MKKLLPIFIFFIIFTTEAFAGDLPESVITNWDMDVFIGEITEIKDGKITIAVNCALFENYDVSEITLDEFEYMTLDENNKFPKAGDYIAMAVEFKDGVWSIAFSNESLGYPGLTAKSDGLDPATLKLYTGGDAFAERMNKYINNGTYSYENRKEIYDKIHSADESEPTPALPSADMEPDTDGRKIAAETDIVIPPPVAPTPSTDTKKAFNSPLVQYGTITLISAAVGFVFAKRWMNK